MLLKIENLFDVFVISPIQNDMVFKRICVYVISFVDLHLTLTLHVAHQMLLFTKK